MGIGIFRRALDYFQDLSSRRIDCPLLVPLLVFPSRRHQAPPL